MAGFSDLITKKVNQFTKDLEQAEKQAMRKGLQAGVKEYKAIAKPLIPVLSKTTQYRAKGTVQRNLRHRIKVRKNSSNGGFEGKGLIRIRRTNGRKMAAVGANTKDRTDPFYWFMLDRGTKKMKGVHFMEKAKSAGENKALSTAKRVYLEEIQRQMRRWR